VIEKLELFTLPTEFYVSMNKIRMKLQAECCAADLPLKETGQYTVIRSLIQAGILVQTVLSYWNRYDTLLCKIQ
jgi:hypothetical protein